MLTKKVALSNKASLIKAIQDETHILSIFGIDVTDRKHIDEFDRQIARNFNTRENLTLILIRSSK